MIEGKTFRNSELVDGGLGAVATIGSVALDGSTGEPFSVVESFMAEYS
jgi:hypothetical protein